MDEPTSLTRGISPPPTKRATTVKTGDSLKQKVSASVKRDISNHDKDTGNQPSLAAIEAGEAQIHNHLAYFAERLTKMSRPTSPSRPTISMDDFEQLYKCNQYEHGRHFVIHQHDHPISGVHYDLRLQFSATSTISFAIPYGMPGNPNSIRPNRMAIETRVHNLWNNLIESASHSTGSLLIWDTGEYEVLPYRDQPKTRTTDDEMSENESSTRERHASESEKLFAGFQSRHLRLRLHGTRLPEGYTIGLRLPSANDRDGQPKKPRRKRRRTDPIKLKKASRPVETDSESENNSSTTEPSTTDAQLEEEGNEAAIASEAEDEDAIIRANNAYTGASNTIGSIHQRHWFLTLDRKHSGFRKARAGQEEGRWVGDWEPFFVMGKDFEKSVVTGRLANDVMEDEGVKKFIGRRMWRPITE